MEFIINKPIEEITLTNAFVIEVNMMHGDADAYTTDEIVIPKEKEGLAKDVIATLDEMLALRWKQTSDAYDFMPKFLTWFSDEYLGEDGYEPWDKVVYEEWLEAREYSFSWHRDHTNIDYNTTCDSYELFYYDEKGIKHEVEIRKDK